MKELDKASITVRFLNAALRTFFKLLYHQLAWTYDVVALIVSVGLWKSWVLSVLPYLNGPRVLEVGHGPGHLQLALRKKGLQCFGLDESAHMGQLAYFKLSSCKYVPFLVNGYAQFLPFPVHCFDQVVSTFPSDYIFDSITLKDIYRVLTPGGRLIVLPLAWITGRRFHERFAAWLFHFTGQAPVWEDRFLKPILQAGFRVHVEYYDLKSSRILIILADKNYSSM